jgi:DNA polymerase I-like protein with 3'-5' exonuclease and polymerase domains
MSKMLGRPVPRIRAKALAFTILYGAGPGKVANMMGIEEDEARALITAYKNAVATKLQQMIDLLKKRYKLKQPFKTLGGRLVMGEPARIVDGRMREFSYKMANLLVQGSSADQTKQAMVNFKGPGVLYLSVHDELIVAADEAIAVEAGEALAHCMANALPISVPMMVAAKIGDNYKQIK